MSEHLTIGIGYQDEDVILLQAQVATAAFKGRTEANADHALLQGWLDSLRGFSRAQGSEVKFDAGVLEEGHIGLVLSRLDWSGHCACRVSLSSNRPTEFFERAESVVEVKLVVEPGALERFVREFESMVERQAGEATLTGLAHG